MAVSWTSADGVTWQRSPANDMAVLGGLNTGGVTAAAVSGTGPVAAVGGSSALQLWTSADGRRWTPEQPPATRLASGDARVASDGRAHLVAAGGSALWLRDAGGAWADVGADRTVFPQAARTSSLRDVVRAGDRYVANGSDSDGVALWLSPDGLNWSRREDPDGDFAGGYIDALAARDGLVIAAGTASNVAAVWLSDDGGGAWRRIDSGNPAFRIRRHTQMTGVAAGNAGVVAVGLSWDDVTIDAHAWHSVDGRIWRRAIDPPAWSGGGDQVLLNACALPGGGFLALAYSVVQGARTDSVWLSADGLNWEPATGGPPLSELSCTAAAGGVVVAGSQQGAGGEDLVLTRTVDGRSWTSAGPVAMDADDPFASMAGDGDRIVVAAGVGGDVRLFTSADAGATWREHAVAGLRGAGYQGVWDVVIVGDEVVMTGWDGAGAAVWIGPAP